MKKCLNCNKTLEGRSDKNYCDIHCKSAYQYQQIKLNGPSLYQKIDKKLKLNRKILKAYNKAGKATVRSKSVIGQGFDPNYFTHYWKNSKQDVYLFVYEFGFLKRTENNIDKFILVKWQDYMKFNR